MLLKIKVCIKSYISIFTSFDDLFIQIKFNNKLYIF